MSAVQLWGYEPTGKVWLPIKVDSSGRIIADLSNVDLGDLADVNLSSPAENDVLCYDEASSEWINKGALFLADIVRAANFQMIPTAGGWVETVNGSGVCRQQPFRNLVYTNAGANGSYARLHTQAYGYNEAGTYQFINWGKEVYFIFNYSRYRSVSGVEAWVKLAEEYTLADLAAQGIGLKAENMDIYGQSYGTSLAETSLSTTLTNQEQCQIVIWHSPGNFVKFYVNGTLKATHSTAANVPSGVGTAAIWLMHAFYDGGSATPDLTVSNMMQGKIWQER